MNQCFTTHVECCLVSINGVGGGGAGGASAPPKFWFVEKKSDVPKIWAKSVKILRVKIAPNVVWFEIMESNVYRITCRPFFWRSSQMKVFMIFVGKNVRTKSFWAILGKFGKKSLAPPKTCLLLHLWLVKYHPLQLAFSCVKVA